MEKKNKAEEEISKRNKLPKPTDLSKAFDRVFKKIKKNHERASNKPAK